MKDDELYSILQKSKTMQSLSLHRHGEPNTFKASLIDEIKMEMLNQEQLKYPTPPYSCKFARVTTSQGNMLAICVQYNGTPLSLEQLKHMRGHSIILRKLSILAGIINGLHFSKDFLTRDPKQRAVLEKQLIEAYKSAKILPILSEAEEMNQFIKDVSFKIQHITGNSEPEVTRQIRNAERYFVAEYNRNRILINEINSSDNTIIQMDIPFRNLITEKQKNSFVAIHYKNDASRPAWFNRLPKWEKDWFLAVVPKSTNDDWSHFTSLFKSSAMTHMPGINNARMNYIMQKNATENYEMISHSFKIGTMVPYEIKKEIRQSETESTAEQVLDHLSQEARDHFKATWKDIQFPPTIKPIIFMSGLLSDTVGGGNDTKLMIEQMQAVKKTTTKKDYTHVEIITGNDPVNFLRFVAAESGPIAKKAGRWDHTKRIMDDAIKMVQFLNLKQNSADNLTPSQDERLKLIKEAHETLSRLEKKFQLPRFDRNFNAFKTAYTDILVEAMGGMVSTNCKSGKDRTGLDEIYRQAMHLYFKRYKKLPDYDESVAEHQKFIDIFITLYNSMKTQEAAAANTPGSFGIKDDAMMLCRDIVKALGDSYKASNKRANMNKPASFKKDESVEAAELKEDILENDKSDTTQNPSIIEKDLKDNLLKDLIDREFQVIEMMAKLDEYIIAPNPGNKKYALGLYQTLDQLNKKIRQLEANIEDIGTVSLKKFIDNLDQSYNLAIKSYERNKISIFITRIQGKSSRYDEIINSGKKKSINESMINNYISLMNNYEKIIERAAHSKSGISQIEKLIGNYNIVRKQLQNALKFPDHKSEAQNCLQKSEDIVKKYSAPLSLSERAYHSDKREIFKLNVAKTKSNLDKISMDKVKEFLGIPSDSTTLQPQGETQLHTNQKTTPLFDACVNCITFGDTKMVSRQIEKNGIPTSEFYFNDKNFKLSRTRGFLYTLPDDKLLQWAHAEVKNFVDNISEKERTQGIGILGNLSKDHVEALMLACAIEKLPCYNKTGLTIKLSGRQIQQAEKKLLKIDDSTSGKKDARKKLMTATEVEKAQSKIDELEKDAKEKLSPHSNHH